MIDKIIERLEEEKKTVSTYSPVSDCIEHNCTVNKAIAIVKRVAQEHKGCEYCNGEDINETIAYLSLDNGDTRCIIFNYCPMCGRKLPKEAD